MFGTILQYLAAFVLVFAMCGAGYRFKDHADNLARLRKDERITWGDWLLQYGFAGLLLLAAELVLALLLMWVILQ